MCFTINEAWNKKQALEKPTNDWKKIKTSGPNNPFEADVAISSGKLLKSLQFSIPSRPLITDHAYGPHL